MTANGAWSWVLAVAIATLSPSLLAADPASFGVKAARPVPAMQYGGQFEIQRIGARTGTFRFTGFDKDMKMWHDVITVDAGEGGNVRLAIVKRMVELIRKEFPEKFVWNSRRLSRAVTLSTAPAESASLEDFLMLEFFGLADEQIAAKVRVLEANAERIRGELAALKDEGNPSERRWLLEKELELDQIQMQVLQDLAHYQALPRRNFVGARAPEPRFARYVNDWRQAIERIGNVNYPSEAKAKGLSGSLQLTVSIKPDGEVEAIEIVHSSGHKVLDEAAVRIVRLAAPFERFPDDIRADTDILHITRTWSFLRGADENLASLTLR